MPADILRDTDQTGPQAPPPADLPAKRPEPPSLTEWYRSEVERINPRLKAAEDLAQAEHQKWVEGVAGLRQKVEALPAPPEPVEAAPAPSAPKIAARPFLDAMPGEKATDSLQKLLLGVGLLGQMAVGLKGGFPQGATAAYTGALQGWSAGDHERAQNEWQTYLGQLQQYDRDTRNLHTNFRERMERYGADKDRLGLEMGLLAAEHGMGKEGIELAFREPERALGQLDTQVKILDQMNRDAANVTFRNLAQLETARHNAEIERHNRKMEGFKEESAGAGKMKWAPTGAGWFDKETGEIVPGVPEGDLKAHPDRYKGLAHQDVQTLDFLKNTQPQIERLKTLVGRLAAEQPGMNLFKAAELAGQGRLAVSPDLREAVALNRDLLVEMVRALGGSSVVRIGLMKALEKDVGFKPTDTVETGYRALETMDRALKNRVAGITGQPLSQFQPSGDKSTAKPLSADEYKKIRAKGYTDDEIRAKGYEIP